MTDEFYTGSWEGYYIYESNKRKRGQQIDFKLELTVEDGVLNGQAIEEVTEIYMGAPAAVSGFIEGDMISMIKQYPFRYSTNDEGEVVIDRSQPHPPIHYTGYFDPQSNSFSGEWAIGKVSNMDFFGGPSLNISCGTWRIEKKPAE